MRRLILYSVILCGLGTASQAVYAQITELTHADQLPADAPTLGFSGLSEGADASESLSRWGIRFDGTGMSSPRIRMRDFLPPLVPEPIPYSQPVLRNASGNPNAGEALVITSRFPLRSIGLSLHDGTPTTRALVSAFGPFGESLGQIDRVGIAGQEATSAPTFLGLTTTSESGISKLVIEYSDPDGAEELVYVTLDFSESRVFETCVPQIAAGPMPDGESRLETVLSLTSLDADGEDEALVSFRGPDGGAIAFMVDGGMDSSVLVPFPDRQAPMTRVISVASVESVSKGYACVRSHIPMEINVLYRLLDSANVIVGQAGIEAGKAGARFVGPALRSTEAGLETAIAVANPGQQMARLSFRLPFCESTCSNGREAEVELGPGEQRALFLPEMFDALPDDFEGTITLSSDLPVVATLLLSVDGRVSASLPIGPE